MLGEFTQFKFNYYFFGQFDATVLFDKWVGIRVPDSDTVPADIRTAYTDLLQDLCCILLCRR
jgi:hypothetical protein